MLRFLSGFVCDRRAETGAEQGYSRIGNVQNTTTLKNYRFVPCLSQLTSLLKLDASAFYCIVQPTPRGEESRALTLAATGNYVDFYPTCSLNCFLIRSRAAVWKLSKEPKLRFMMTLMSFNCLMIKGVNSILYVNLEHDLDELGKATARDIYAKYRTYI